MKPADNIKTCKTGVVTAFASCRIIVSWNMDKRDENALFSLAPLIQKELNITSVLPYLIKHDLTTSEEREILLSSSMCNIEKKNLLLFSWLPNKGNNSLDRFVEALKESKEGTTHETLAHKIEEERLTKADEEFAASQSNNSTDRDSGYDITAKSFSHGLSTSLSSWYSKSQEGNLSPASDDIFDNDQSWELVSSDSDLESVTLQNSLQKKYTQVMGPNGVAKIVHHIEVGEFRLFCYNITRTAADYTRMGNECSRSIDVWCRVSMKCSYCYFSPLESICRQFGGEALKLVKEYQELLHDKKFKTILSKTKPDEGYQLVTEPKELFASCVASIATSLNDRITCRKILLDDMKSYFCTLKTSSVDHEQELFITNNDIQDNIAKAKDVFFLLFAISPCWDCINFLFFEEHVVKQFGGNEEKQQLEKYKRHLKNRWLASSLEKYPDMAAELTCFKNCYQVQCRINAEWDTTKIKQILRLKEVIASVYNIGLSAVKLYKVTRGSIIVYFALPSSCIKELSDEQIILLADHEFLELTVHNPDSVDENKVIISYNILERFIALDNSFQTSVNHSATYNIKLSSDVSLVEKIIKHRNSATTQDFQPKKVFKHWVNHYIVLQTFTTFSRLNVYHNELSYKRGKGPIDSRILYGIDVQMKSDKRKPHILALTNPNCCLSISFSTQTDAQQWFTALTQIAGCFHLQLKMSPSHRSFPEDLVVQLKEDHMTFWSVLNQQKCLEWQLSDIKSIHLHKALYINIKSLSNTPLKEDIFVFEGKQLEKLFDLLEENLLALPDNSSCEKNLFNSSIAKQKSIGNKLVYSSSQEVLGNDTVKQIKKTQSLASFTSEESGSLDSFSTSGYLLNDILSELFSAESASTVYHIFSWKVKDEMHLQDKVIQLVKTSWFDLVSRHILNRGYRIIVTLPGQQTRILAQEKNNPEGKKQIQNRWEKTVRVLNKAYVVLKHPNCATETGYFQADTMVVETSEVHDLSLPHFQFVYYGTVKPSRLLHHSTTKCKETLYTGMAQCTIPPALLKEMYSNLSKNGFWLKLWHSPASNTNISINYLNETEQDEFKKILDEPILDSKHTPHFQNSEILLYIPHSSKSFNENLAQTSQLAVDLGFSGKVVLFDWYTEKENSSTDKEIEEAIPQLLRFLKMLCSQASKVHIIAVHDAALLLVKTLNESEFNLGQVILTRLLSLSCSIFGYLQRMACKSESVLLQADNITIYHKPKSCNSSMFPLRSFTVASGQEILPKKLLLKPPPFVPKVDIICLGSHPNRSLIKNREYAVNKVVIEDMSEIICFGKSVKDRSSRLRIQCGCRDLKPPTDRSHLPCKICNCYYYFVLGHVVGLGNFIPTVLEEMQQQILRQYHEKCDTHETKKCLSIYHKSQIEEIFSHQYRKTTIW